MEANFYIEKLIDYYGVATISELAAQINTTQSTISTWKNRNSIGAIKKKCRQLGIYNDIFTNDTHLVNNFDNALNMGSGDQFVGNKINADKHIYSDQSKLQKNVEIAIDLAVNNNKIDDLNNLIKVFIKENL